jgi:hypothetical protein
MTNDDMKKWMRLAESTLSSPADHLPAEIHRAGDWAYHPPAQGSDGAGKVSFQGKVVGKVYYDQDTDGWWVDSLTHTGQDWVGEYTDLYQHFEARMGIGDRAQSDQAISESDNYSDHGHRLEEIVYEMKELLGEAWDLVQGTPEEGRAKGYWYAHILMALDDDHGYMGRSTATMKSAAEALMSGPEDFDDESEGPWSDPGR